jgi:hypothetical protein
MRTTHEAEAHADSSRELMPELQLAARCSSLSHDYNALILMAFVAGGLFLQVLRKDRQLH